MERYRSIITDEFEAVQPKVQPAPQIMWVKIAELVIDQDYQRPLARGNVQSIKRIASDFQWARFSPIIVAPVEGGLYSVIDGQHRAHAAAVCGFESVPAMVALVAPEDQAKAFVEINTSQIRVSAYSVYKASLVAGDDWAIRARDAVEAAGCRLMTTNFSTNDKKQGMVFSIALIRGLIEKGHDNAVTAGLSALFNFEINVANFSDAMLRPWLNAVVKTGVTDVDILVRALKKLKPWVVMETAANMAKESGAPVAPAKRDAFAVLIKSVPEEVL